MEFVVEEDETGGWRWRLQDRFARRIAESAIAFDSMARCLLSIEEVRAAHAAPVRQAFLKRGG